MSTNYYCVVNVCTQCGRGEVYHLGKSSGIYKFMFHGSKNVRNFEQWKALVLSADIVYNEYGSAVDKHYLVDSSIHMDFDREYTLIGDGSDWFDSEGNYFLEREFS